MGDTRPVTFSLSRDVLEDWLTVLIQENKERVKNSSAHSSEGWFKTRQAAELVFNLCKQLSQSYEVRYVALEIFDKFMTQHCQELHDHVQTSTGIRHRSDEWTTLLKRVQKQVPLRVLSCIRLASQLANSYKPISTQKVSSILTEFGHKYTVSSVVRSDMRILRTVQYRIMLTTPLVYIEALLAVLDYNEKSLCIAECHGTCLNLLDVVYLQRTDIYKQLSNITSRKLHDAGKTDEASRKLASTAALGEDYQLLAAAVIASASYLMDQRKTDEIVDCLTRVTHLSADDILDLATIIAQHILVNNEL